MARTKEQVEPAADEAAGPPKRVKIKVVAYKIPETSEGRLLEGHMTWLPADEAAALAAAGQVVILDA